MARKITAQSVREMFSSIASGYDLGNTGLSFGLHHLWKRRLVKLLPAQAGLRTLDVCTGTGDLIPLLSRRFGSVVAVDFCRSMLQRALVRQKLEGSDGVLIEGDVLKLPFRDGEFDVITVAFGVRNLSDLLEGLHEIRRVLKEGGGLLILETGQPENRVLNFLYRLYSFFWVPFVGQCVSGNRAAYRYLTNSAAAFPCGSEFEARLKQAGLRCESAFPLVGGIAYMYVVRRAEEGGRCSSMQA